MKFVRFLIDLVQELRVAQSNAERRREEARLRRYYRNKRLYGCGCCDGLPSWPRKHKQIRYR